MDQSQDYNKRIGYAATDPSTSFSNYGFQSKYSISQSYSQSISFKPNFYNQIQY